MNLLIVDDEHDVERLFRQRLREEIRTGKVQMRFAFSAEEALEVLGNDPTDGVMIFSDINMPGMGGLELLEKLRSEGATYPIWMISAYENDHYQEEARRLGATGFFPKPLDFGQLRSIILQGGAP